MKASKIRDMSIDELKQEAQKLQDQLLKLRIQKVTAKLDNPMKITNVRRDVARILTVLGEKERTRGKTDKKGA